MTLESYDNTKNKIRKIWEEDKNLSSFLNDTENRIFLDNTKNNNIKPIIILYDSGWYFKSSAPYYSIFNKFVANIDFPMNINIVKNFIVKIQKGYIDFLDFQIFVDTDKSLIGNKQFTFKKSSAFITTYPYRYYKGTADLKLSTTALFSDYVIYNNKADLPLANGLTADQMIDLCEIYATESHDIGGVWSMTYLENSSDLYTGLTGEVATIYPDDVYPNEHATFFKQKILDTENYEIYNIDVKQNINYIDRLSTITSYTYFYGKRASYVGDWSYINYYEDGIGTPIHTFRIPKGWSASNYIDTALTIRTFTCPQYSPPNTDFNCRVLCLIKDPNQNIQNKSLKIR